MAIWDSTLRRDRHSHTSIAMVARNSPVSYTHLDVYKRQILICVSFNDYRIYAIAVVAKDVCNLWDKRLKEQMCIRDSFNTTIPFKHNAKIAFVFEFWAGRDETKRTVLILIQIESD